MNDQRVTNHSGSNWVRFAPGKPVLVGVNWGGLKTLYIKEVRRFFKVQLQTVWAPAITTLLYLAIFTIALGGSGRSVMGVRFADFIAPGLIVMAMMQNAFANSSFSLLVGKIQGNIVDYLMPPLSTGELIAGLVGAAVTRAFLVGFAVWLAMLLWPGVSVGVVHPLLVFWFALASQRHFLFGPSARAELPGGEPRQPLLLRDLRFPRGVPGDERFALVGGRGRASGAEPAAVGGLLRALEERMENQELNFFRGRSSRSGAASV